MQTTNHNQSGQEAPRTRRKRGEKIACSRCQERESDSRGLCRRCYARYRRAKKREERGLPPLPPREPQAPVVPTAATIAEANRRAEEFEIIFARVRRKADFSFRALPWFRRQDLVQEAVALAWDEILRMLQVGKEPTEHSWKIADYVVRRMRDGRCFVHGSKPSQDALSPLAQTKHSFLTLQLNFSPAWRESPVLFVDLLDWIASLTDQEAELVELFTHGYSVEEVAERMDMMPGQVEAIRTELYEQWQDRR